MAQRIKKVEVPLEQIEPDTLRALVEEYITRDGTFYGKVEMPMDQKIDMVIRQLETGEAYITWDLYLQSGTIELREKN